jgi:hypothetical protein
MNRKTSHQMEFLPKIFQTVQISLNPKNRWIKLEQLSHGGNLRIDKCNISKIVLLERMPCQ